MTVILVHRAITEERGGINVLPLFASLPHLKGYLDGIRKRATWELDSKAKTKLPVRKS